MRGMNSTDGTAIEGTAHLRQSVADILSTPLGSRVMRRDYGSRLFDLLDAPLNDVTKSEMFAATAEALVRWEPRIRVELVQVSQIAEGAISLDLTALYLPTGTPVFLDGITLSA